MIMNNYEYNEFNKIANKKGKLDEDDDDDEDEEKRTRQPEINLEDRRALKAQVLTCFFLYKVLTQIIESVTSL